LSDYIKDILLQVHSGNITIEDAEQLFTYENLNFAKVDHYRKARNGFPETVFAMGKTPEQVAMIMKSIYRHSQICLATRATNEHFAAVKNVLKDATYHQIARCITVGKPSGELNKYKVAVVAAGTSDMPVAEEAVITLESLGITPERIYDVGVAGLHRLLNNLACLQQMQAIIVIAGMDGALPSVIGGLVACPVIAVPTSIGYGSNFNGLAPLLSMLNSCASGVTVVNIDNGFGAAFAAGAICRTIQGGTHG